MRIEQQYQYPNLYVLFVGPPGRGKSNAVKVARNNLLSKMGGVVNLSPTSVTKEAFYIKIEEGKKQVKIFGENYAQMPMIAFIDEWSVFVEEGDNAFMSLLGDIYDNPPVIDYVTKNRGTNHLESPCLTMLGGVTPKQLRERFTDSALEQGFPSRVLMIYCDQLISVPTNLRRKGDGSKDEFIDLLDPDLEKRLLHDLTDIARISGEFEFDDEGADAFEGWITKGMMPVPSDSRLIHYCTRRIAHLSKLCMIYSAARTDTLLIKKCDFDMALADLLEAEKTMAHAVSALGASKQLDSLKLVKDFVEAYHKRHNKAVAEFQIRRAMASEVEPHMMNIVIESALRMQWIRKIGEDKYPMYLPGMVNANGKSHISSESPAPSAKPALVPPRTGASATPRSDS